jgi:transcriptional regulator of heat shock response
MEDRLAQLLRALVEEYVASAEPVASQSLVDRECLDVSSATVRNWLVELEEEGYLLQPHTSGGRIPTEKGYRFYVERFVTPKPASKRDQEMLSKVVSASDEEERRWKGMAKALADLSGEASLVGLNEADTFYTGLSQLFAQPEFKNWQRVVSLTEVLDRLDETLQGLRRSSIPEPRILLGRDCPFGPLCGLAVVSVPRGLMGILGPMRMDYQRALSLLSSAFSLFQKT